MVHELLNEGIDNTRSGGDLCRSLNITKRALTLIIEKERREGHPICATCNNANPGYFLAADKREMENYCNALRHRAGEIFKTRDACIKTIDELPEPPEDPFEAARAKQ